MHSHSPGSCSQAPYAVQVLRETDPSSVTEHGLYERPVDKMPDEVRAPLCINQAVLASCTQYSIESRPMVRQAISYVM